MECHSPIKLTQLQILSEQCLKYVIFSLSINMPQISGMAGFGRCGRDSRWLIAKRRHQWQTEQLALPAGAPDEDFWSG